MAKVTLLKFLFNLLLVKSLLVNIIIMKYETGQIK